MERQQYQMLIDKQLEEMKQKNEGKRDGQQIKQQEQLIPAPSASSSPSHEFSFTISLHPTKIPDKNKSPKTPFTAIDLSPADEIFFHGHLLPLHLLANLPVSPRSSTNSLDSFTLPIEELSEDNISTSSTRSDYDQYIKNDHFTCQESSLLQGKGRGKFNSFSLFRLPRRRKESCETGEKDHQERQKRKSKFDMSYCLQRYMRLVKPLIRSFRKRRGNNSQIQHQQPRSFSGNLQVMRSNKELRGKRGEFSSAPVSMRTSPTNSGLLVANGTLTPTKSDSTMEELQAAIQAAIAHCKKSIATEDKNEAAMTT